MWVNASWDVPFHNLALWVSSYFYSKRRTWDLSQIRQCDFPRIEPVSHPRFAREQTDKENEIKNKWHYCCTTKLRYKNQCFNLNLYRHPRCDIDVNLNNDISIKSLFFYLMIVERTVYDEKAKKHLLVRYLLRTGVVALRTCVYRGDSSTWQSPLSEQNNELVDCSWREKAESQHCTRRKQKGHIVYTTDCVVVIIIITLDHTITLSLFLLGSIWLWLLS